jgi:hypothetical protein
MTLPAIMKKGMESSTELSNALNNCCGSTIREPEVCAMIEIVVVKTNKMAIGMPRNKSTKNEISKVAIMIQRPF